MSVKDPVAVIDIGSNSVRLVIFDGISLAPIRVFDERYNCGLARKHEAGQPLDARKVSHVFNVFRRFASILDNLGVRHRLAVGTAAVRDASNGDEFIEKGSDILGTRIDIASGEREAQLLSYGITSGFWGFDGVAGDLGGGSLELIEIKNNPGLSSNQQTMPFGVLRVFDEFQSDPPAFLERFDEALRQNPVVPLMKDKPFALVGGTWRALGRIAFARSAPPFGVLHNLPLSPETTLGLFDELISVPAKKMSRIKGIDAVEKSRWPYLAAGAALLSRLITVGKPETIVISCTGIREGLVASLLKTEELMQDPLIIGARDVARERVRDFDYAEALYPFARDLMSALGFTLTESQDRLLKAGAYFSECHWRIHPDHRGREALNDLTHMYAYGLSQEDRVFLGIVLLVRYDGKLKNKFSEQVAPWIRDSHRDLAVVLGLVFRFTHWLSASSARLISGITLQRVHDKYVKVVLKGKGFPAGEGFSPSALTKLMSLTSVRLDIVADEK